MTRLVVERHDVASSAQAMTKKTQVSENYCGASRSFAEMSRISLVI